MPAAASRRIRDPVERGSIPYSAVTQPSPVLRRKGGTRSSQALTDHQAKVLYGEDSERANVKSRLQLLKKK